jgi:hypothetical protein
MLIFKPGTVLRWHRELVRRKWTFRRKSNPGRPKLSSELEALIIQLAKENTRWGAGYSNLVIRLAFCQFEMPSIAIE